MLGSLTLKASSYFLRSESLSCLYVRHLLTLLPVAFRQQATLEDYSLPTITGGSGAHGVRQSPVHSPAASSTTSAFSVVARVP